MITVTPLFLSIIAPSGPPLDFAAEAVSSTSVRLSWAPPLPGDQNGVVVRYYINITEAETGDLLQLEADGTDVVVIINSLHPHYTYVCVIAAFTIGLGPSAHAEVITDSEGKCSIVTY